MKKLMMLMLVLALALSASAALAYKDGGPDRDRPSRESADRPSKDTPDRPSKDAPDKPDHCGKASEKAKEAADHFGKGEFGSAAEKLGEAAGAARECVREKTGGRW